MVAAINLVSDATGVVAAQAVGYAGSEFHRIRFEGLVDTEVISEGAGGVFEANWVGALPVPQEPTLSPRSTA